MQFEIRDNHWFVPILRFGSFVIAVLSLRELSRSLSARLVAHGVEK